MDISIPILAQFDQFIKGIDQCKAAISELEISAKSVGIGITETMNKLAGSTGQNSISISNYNTLIRNQKERIRELEQAYKQLKNQRTQTAQGYLADIEREKTALSQLRAEQDKAIKSGQNLNNQHKDISKTVKSSNYIYNQGIGILKTYFGAYAAFSIIKDAFNVIGDFDQTLHKLQSVAGLTNKELADFKENIIQIGRNSVYGVQGVAEMNVELAKMGFSATEIQTMSQAIDDLATATQEKLPESAEVVANVLRSYNLSASEAKKVTDIMGQSFNASSLDLASFRESIKYVAPIMKQNNFTFEETAAMLMQLANSGLKGSLAGTGLTNIISRLGNESSSLSKSVGHTTSGFNEFMATLEEVKKKGTDIFEIVDRRAVAAFSLLMNNVEAVKEYRNQLVLTEDVIARQAAVQKESLQNQIALAKEAYKAMLVENDNFVKIAGKGLAQFWRNLWSPVPSKQYELLIENIDKALLNNFLTPETRKELLKRKKELELLLSSSERWDVSNLFAGAVPYLAQVAEMTPEYKDAENAAIKTLGIIQKAAKDKAEIMSKAGEEEKIVIDKLIKAYKNMGQNEVTAGIKAVTNEMSRLNEEVKKIEKGEYFNYITGKKENISIFSMESLEIAKRKEYDLAIIQTKRDYLSNLLQTLSQNTDEQTEEEKKKLKKLKSDLLNAEKDYWDTIIKYKYTGSEQSQKIEENNYKYEVLISKNEIENKKELHLRLQTLEIEHNTKMEDIRRKSFTDIINESKKLLENVKKTNEEQKKEIDQIIKNFRTGYNEDSLTAFASLFAHINTPMIKVGQWINPETGEIGDIKDIDPQLKKFWDEFYEANEKVRLEEMGKSIKKKGNDNAIDIKTPKEKKSTIWSLLGIDDDDTIKNAEALFNQLTSIITKWADTTVEQYQRTLDAENTRISQLQTDIQIEQADREAGYASNVDLLKKELKEEKAKRKETLDDLKKAKKTQLNIETALQASGLITTSVNLLKDGSKLGIPGILIAIAAIAGVFALYESYVSQSKAISQESNQYGKGGHGILGGKRHSDGGVDLGVIGTGEQGEMFSILNRNATAKQGKQFALLTDLVNKDKINLNREAILNFNKDINISFGKNKQLEDIKNLLTPKKIIHIEYQNDYRIEKFGTITKRIRLN